MKFQNKSILVISSYQKLLKFTRLHLFPSVNLRIQPKNSFQKLLKQHLPVPKPLFYAFSSQKCAYLCIILSITFLRLSS